jgi:hypothetical protein
LKALLKVCFGIKNTNRILFVYILELDQEEDRRKQEVDAARPMEDEDFDDPIETEVSRNCIIQLKINSYE